MLKLSSPAFYIWTAVVIVNIALAWIVRSKNACASYRWFSHYNYFQACASAVGLATCFAVGGIPYFVVYYVLTLCGTVMAFAVALEIHAKVFGPIGFRPRWVTDRLLAMFGMGMAAAITVGVLLAATNGGRWTRALVKAEQVSTAALWASFVILWMYSRALKITWRRHAMGIERGFVFYLSISAVAVFVRARSPEYAAMAGQAELLAYLAAVLWWCGALWRKEPATAKASRRVLAAVLADYQQTRSEAALHHQL